MTNFALREREARMPKKFTPSAEGAEGEDVKVMTTLYTLHTLYTLCTLYYTVYIVNTAHIDHNLQGMNTAMARCENNGTDKV